MSFLSRRHPGKEPPDLSTKLSDNDIEKVRGAFRTEFTRQPPTIAVIGVSGTGKSSTINAMLAPRVPPNATSAPLIASFGSVVGLPSGPMDQPAGIASPRSAALAARDLTPNDFPRYKKIAQDVYTYEGLHVPDKDGTIINTVSLIVVTDDGVVVVDGQGDQKQGEEMIDNIKKITAQPVKYMVIASDHGDHTGGNGAFKTAFP